MIFKDCETFLINKNTAMELKQLKVSSIDCINFHMIASDYRRYRNLK